MNISSILVETYSRHLDQLVAELNHLPSIEVHFADAASGRIVAIIEAESVDAEVEGLKTIKALPQVLYAEMVYHYFEGDTPLASPLTATE